MFLSIDCTIRILHKMGVLEGGKIVDGWMYHNLHS